MAQPGCCRSITMNARSDRGASRPSCERSPSLGVSLATQVISAMLAALVHFLIANGKPGFSAIESGFASNGYGSRSPGGHGLGAALLIEVVLSAAFLDVILGATDDRAPTRFAPIAIGLALALIHLISIPVTNTSVNPARSIGVARFAGGAALSQLWLFILAPTIGGAVAGASYAAITGAKQRP
jgi:aquaporin Z